MKRVLLVAVLILSGCARPDFVDTAGNGYRLADFQGEWLIVNYWATWCAPCIQEIPELIALGEAHDDIHVFGVNYDEPEGAEIQQQIEKMKITFPVIATDPYLLLGVERPEVLPTTLIIGPDGQLRDSLIGPQTIESLLAAMER